MSVMTANEMFEAVKTSIEFHQEAAKLEFALELKRFMEQEEVTNADLADRLGVSRPMVSKLLRGDANVTIETMVKACRSVGGKLFVKIAREGCSARMFELAKSVSRADLKDRAQRNSHLHDAFHAAANDLELTDYADEIQSIAA